MKGKIICMASAKGGSGKTTLTASLGEFLNELGKKVLIVDTDASTNGLTLLFLREVMIRSEEVISENRKPMGVFNRIYRFDTKDDLESLPPDIVTLRTGLTFIPATYQFQNTEDISFDAYYNSLRTIRALYGDHYDYIFLDAQAGSDIFAKIAMDRDISDEVILISEYDPMSAAGIERLKALFKDDLSFERTWILINKMLPEFVKSFSDFLEVAKYLPPIPWTASVVKAYSRRKLALDFETLNEFTLAIIQVSKTLFTDQIEIVLSDWLAARHQKLLSPLNERRVKLETELAGMIELEKTHRFNERRKRLYMLSGSFAVLTALLLLIIKALPNELMSDLVGFDWNTWKLLVFPIVLLLVSLSFPVFFKTYLRSDIYDTYSDSLQARQLKIKNQLAELDFLISADIDMIISRNKQLAFE